jgi:hypothetical protein
MILVALGYHGTLEGNAGTTLTVRGGDLKTVICPITEKYVSVIKMSDERRAELSALLYEAGLRFNGGGSSEPVDFMKAESFTVTYINDDFFPIGLKLIAESALNTKGDYKLENTLRKIVLRGDFRPLANAVPKPYKLNMVDYGSAQPVEIREWLAAVHSLLTGGGCVEYLGHTPFTYIKRGTTVTHGMVCTIDVNIGGCVVIPGVNHLSLQREITDILPNYMADIMTQSARTGKFDIADCRRKSGNMAFVPFTFKRDGREYEGCRHAGILCQYAGIECPFNGFSFDLSKTETRETLLQWSKREVEYNACK